jgi:hypothetical protein
MTYAEQLHSRKNTLLRRSGGVCDTVRLEADGRVVLLLNVVRAPNGHLYGLYTVDLGDIGLLGEERDIPDGEATADSIELAFSQFTHDWSLPDSLDITNAS